ncbi:hypothetical protein FA95DRAFT_1556590 [Auriscalpium vulgare]|uniref:Uncharacterized protein n=1 Tax=Auriscalpium vulgare TaxID=40419 RepID=A0ACB8S1I0_9AGAM|nr:hypothetical protein FA95DRAFT_1556590 [Auriscalpium vulgare]
MVLIHILSPKGNGARAFPFHGHLGLTPLTVQAAVLVRPDPSAKALLAHSLTVYVRCYEAHHGRTGQIHANRIAEYPAVLWQPPPDTDAAPLVDLDAPFRITVPRDSPGFSTAFYPDYRVFWRVEAVIAHPYVVGLGARQVKTADLTVLRYGEPSAQPPLPTPAPFLLPRQTSKLRAPVLRYHVGVPIQQIGPDDLLSVSITLSALDSSVNVRSASLTVERRIQIREPPLSPDLLLSPPPPDSPSLAPPYPPASSTYTLDSIASSAHSRTPLFATPHDHDPDSSPLKLITHIVAGTESTSGRFVRDPATGLWSRTLTLQWPAPRSTNRWSVGETMDTDMVRIGFFVKVKLVVTSASGTDSLELQEEPITVALTNNADRQLALSKYHAARPPPSPTVPVASTSRTKPRRPVQMEAWGPAGVASAATATAKPSKERRNARPHTSGGRPRTSTGASSSAWRPGSASSSFPGVPKPPPIAQSVSAPLPQVPVLVTPTATRINTITGETSVSSMPEPPGEHVRAWEEELERIEARSRMSSVHAGSGASRRRVGVGGG